MTEIDQLRQDIEKLENAMPIAKRLGAQATCATLGALKSEIEFELAKLEAEAAAKADPWAKAVDIIYGWTKIVGQEHDDERLIVAKYFVHMESQMMDLKHDCNEAKSQLLGFFMKTGFAENKVAELEAELAKRPVVWCVRNREKEYEKGVYGIRLFSTEKDAERYSLHTLHEPYTGEQK